MAVLSALANFRHCHCCPYSVTSLYRSDGRLRDGAIIAVINSFSGGVFRAVDNCSEFLDVAVVIVVVARFDPLTHLHRSLTRASSSCTETLEAIGDIRIDKCLLYHGFSVILVLNIDFAFKVGSTVQITVAIVGIVQRITVRIGNAGSEDRCHAHIRYSCGLRYRSRTKYIPFDHDSV